MFFMENFLLNKNVLKVTFQRLKMANFLSSYNLHFYHQVDNSAIFKKVSIIPDFK
jgi:hypothetical protein